jgi:hypothetical protein
MMGCMKVCLISIPGKAEVYNLHYGNYIAPILRSVCVCPCVRVLSVFVYLILVQVEKML